MCLSIFTYTVRTRYVNNISKKLGLLATSIASCQKQHGYSHDAFFRPYLNDNSKAIGELADSRDTVVQYVHVGY